MSPGWTGSLSGSLRGMRNSDEIEGRTSDARCGDRWHGPGRPVGGSGPGGGWPRRRERRRRQPARPGAPRRVLPGGAHRHGQGLRRPLPVPPGRHLSPRGEPGPQRSGPDRRLRQQRAQRPQPYAGGGRPGGLPGRLRLQRDGHRPTDRRQDADPDPVRRDRAAPVPERVRPEQVPQRGDRRLGRGPLPGDGLGGAADQQRHRPGRLRPVPPTSGTTRESARRTSGATSTPATSAPPSAPLWKGRAAGTRSAWSRRPTPGRSGDCAS